MNRKIFLLIYIHCTNVKIDKIILTYSQCMIIALSTIVARIPFIVTKPILLQKCNDILHRYQDNNVQNKTRNTSYNKKKTCKFLSVKNSNEFPKIYMDKMLLFSEDNIYYYTS